MAGSHSGERVRHVGRARRWSRIDRLLGTMGVAAADRRRGDPAGARRRAVHTDVEARNPHRIRGDRSRERPQPVQQTGRSTVPLRMIGVTGGADLITGPGMEVGFYGKLPSHGDFLRRRVSDAFVGVWDGWLQECIAASRAILGERWLDVYLTSPAWRFACAAGTFGAAPIAGVMVPSVDRVGRYFHLTFVAELPPGAERRRRRDDAGAVLRRSRAAGGRDAGRRAHRLRQLRRARHQAGASPRGDSRNAHG